MTRRVVYSPRAQEQLDRLYLWIAEQSGLPDRAECYVSAILGYCDGLAEFPMIGIARDDLRAGLRTIGFLHRAVITFAVHETAIEIHGVYYGGQDYESLIADENS
ncbi:type II toxin-antitoxin system RelE/ParE family toxin [Raineyella sp. W15-4]|uniref:type II toxin-antitoxin system RelE/ParE family toxin n=1 Tax=Raineyella sp. W15-4 TaxID=3081651 RepID=UPI002954640F|nr:type II toxin-antitoxin system RelE/ParE family toxin [Raineyella sp. W15-4]WOQ16881.1 type II toxin-antitoxin system RelE/ParE family toxin [Raineyella sp. W15-4]